MCAAGDHLALPICTISKRISGTLYEIIVPCGCTGPRFPSSSSRPPESYISEKTTSAVEWTVMSIPPTAEYSFSSLLPSSIPPVYGNGAPQYTADTLVGDVPAQSNQPDSQQLPTSSTSTLSPAYSNLPRKNHVSLLLPITNKESVPSSTNGHTELDPSAQTAACPVCSCPSEAPPAYSSGPSDDGATEKPEEIPSSYGYEGRKPTSPIAVTTECAADQSRQLAEPTPGADGIPMYSKPTEEPSRNDYSYSKKYNIPGANSHAPGSNDWRYLGCYSDSPARVVQGGGAKGFFRGDVSNRKCMDFCKSNGFVTAGTKDGKECWCGHSMAESVQLLPATACSAICHGDSSDYCGGTWAISIYSSADRYRAKPKYGTLAELLALH